jgi:cytochrome c-type biogenesis protein CcmH/NrfG
MNFVSVFILLVLLSFVVIVGLTLVRSRTRGKVLNFDQQNLELYQQRVDALRRSTQGEQSQDQTEQLIDELGLELLGQNRNQIQQGSDLSADIESQSSQPSHRAGLSLRVKIAWLLACLVVAAILYALVFDGITRLSDISAIEAKQSEAQQFLSGQISEPSAQTLSDDSGQQLRVLIAAMQREVHEQPENADYWISLSEAYVATGDIEAALIALQRASRLEPDNQNTTLLMAQTQFFGQGELDPDVKSELQGILRETPNHEGVIMLLLAESVKLKQMEQAQVYLSQIKALIAQKPGDRTLALQSLERLTQTLSIDQGSGAVALSAEIKLTDSAAAMVRSWPDTASLFVYAVSPSGGPPYAVKRMSLADVRSPLMQGTLRLSLSDGDAMLPSQTLSSAKNDMIPLVFRARLSLSDSVEPLASDLMAEKPITSAMLDGEVDSIELIMDSNESFKQ